MTIEIDLKNETQKEAFMRIIGKELHFADWVRYNWDAFDETIRTLDDGANLQPNTTFEFPLTLVFKNTSAFKNASPKEFANFENILQYTKNFYKERGLEMHYSIAS